MMDQRSKRNKPTSGNFAVEQDKAEFKLPILHIDPIWPPHLRKKRALRSFKDIVNRKKIMIKFLSVNPPPSPKPEKFNVKDLETVLTMNERIKIFKEKQNLTLERIKANAKENVERKVGREVESIHGVISMTSNQVHSGIARKIDSKGKEYGKDPWYLRLSNTDKSLNANKYSVHRRKSQRTCQSDKNHPSGLSTQHLPICLPKLEKRTNYLQTVVNEERESNQDHGQPKKVKAHDNLVGKVKELGNYKKEQAQNDDLDILTIEGNKSIAENVRGRKSTEEIKPKHFTGKAKFGNNSKKGKHGNENELVSFRLRPLVDPRFIRLQQALVNPSESKTLKREVRRTSRNTWMTPRLQSIKWAKHWKRGSLH